MADPVKQHMVRGAAKVNEVLAEEHFAMQRRAYRRVRPYMAGSLGRLRRQHRGFQTVVFDADKAAFVLVFGDGTVSREAPRAFAGLKSACEDLAQLSEIEWLTADDALWQVRQDLSVPKRSEIVVQQYRYVENGDAWQFWMRRSLRSVRYYVRQDIFSRVFYGAQRAGFGKRIVTAGGAVVDEWVDPLDAMIVRVLRAKGSPISLDSLCDAMNQITGFQDGYYLWDVLHACESMARKGALRRINPKASESDARFVAVKEAP